MNKQIIQAHRAKKGFTIVELTLAMAFLAVLLITIAILVIRIISIYQNGLSIRAVGATGRELISDFTRTISGSPIVDVSYDPAIDDAITSNIARKSDKLTHKYYFQKYGSIEGISDSTPLAGAFCTGLYTYIWNTGYALDNPDVSGFSLEYTDADGDRVTLDDFRLLKIPDSERSICTDQRIDDNKIDSSKSKFESATIPVELLSASEDDLALYDFRVFPASASKLTGHTFYSATFILATLRGGDSILTNSNYSVNIFADADYCTSRSGGLYTDFNYCAINKFNFAMRATGQSAGDDSYGQKGL